MKKLLLFFLIASLNIFAQSFSGGFNFRLPADDTTGRKFLPFFPAREIAAAEYIRINSDGKFTVNEKPIRFWGANLAADGAFPSKDKAWFIAGRLRKMGFNLVRLHHMDNPWSDNSLLEKRKDTRHLNPVTLDKMENLIYHLKKNGIYVNINLNVSRTFNSLDGIALADSMPDYAKGYTIFDPQLIALEKEYAGQLLRHVNPYTGLALAEDPVMGVVEIINENSLYRMWYNNQLNPFSAGGVLTMRHTKMLDTLWNQFLIDKYKTTDSLRSAWSPGSLQAGTNNLILNGDFESTSLTGWVVELHESAAAIINKDFLNPFSGAASARVTVTKVTGTDWHIQFKQVGFSVKKDSLYTVEFSARSDSSRMINVTVMRDNDPYTSYIGKDVNLNTQWQTFSVSFKAPEANTGKSRLSFSFKNSKGNFWFDNVKITSAGVSGLSAGETLESRSVNRINYSEAVKYSDARVRDASIFYIKLQDDFYSDMKNYLTTVLKVKVPIIGTNWNIGPGDLISQSKYDYIDNHAYWQHPSFPNEPWSSTDWNIVNTAMLKDVNGGTISELFGGVPMTGKPYTVSEYNHPFPNRFQSEMMIFTTAYLSFHNADGIEFFDYNSSTDWETDVVNSFFSIHRNSAFMSLMPACALAYRNKFIAPAKETIKINYNPETIYLLPKTGRYSWQGQILFPGKLALSHAVRTESFNSPTTTDFSLLPQVPVSPYKSDTDEIIWNNEGLLTVNSPKFYAIAGYMNNFPNTSLKGLKLRKANGYGVLAWVSLTEDSLFSSKKSLITISSILQNTGMVWDGTNTIHDKWGNQPTQMMPLDIIANIDLIADSIRVYSLDNYGREFSNASSIIYPVAKNNFEIRFNQNENHTLWFGIEAYGGTYTEVKDQITRPIEFKVDQNFPNPFNNSTRLRYSLPYHSEIKIIIFDALGKEVLKLADSIQEPGTYSVFWNGKNAQGLDVKSGVYFVRFSSGRFSDIKKLVYLK